MRINSSHLILILLLTGLMLACQGSDDDITVLEGPSNSAGSCDIKIDDFSLIPETANIDSYESSSSVTFVNKVDEKSIFQISKVTETVFEGIFTEGDSINFCYSNENITLNLNNGEGLEFTIELETKAYFPDLRAGLSADVLKVYYNDLNNTEMDRRVVFRKVIDLKNYPTSLYETTRTIESQFFINKEFKDIEITDFNTPIIVVYYNDEVGIVAYEDELGILWQFLSKS